MRKFWQTLIIVMLLGLGLAACNRNKTEKLTQTFTAYQVEFQLPDGWREDRGHLNTQVSGGIGFASADYAGLTYLRLHQGAVFAVMGHWAFHEDAAAALEVAFADNISSPESIDVLGLKGTYAHGTLEQGQGVGAVHVIFERNGQPQQLIFLATVANHWENYAPNFLNIIKTLQFTDLE